MRLELWINDAAELRYRAPDCPYRPPPPPWRHLGDFPVDRWGEGITGNFRRLPGGAILGKPREQVYGLGGPHYLYLDRRQDCRDCHGSFLFSATEQQHWYEVRKLWNEVEAHRCPACRKDFREERTAQQRLMAAHAALEAADTPAAHLELAEATLENASRVGRGPLERALGSARKAQQASQLEQAGRAAEEQLRAAIGRCREL